MIDEEIVESRYVTVQEATKILGVCRATIDNYARAGKLKRYESRAPVRTMYDRFQLQKLKQVTPKYQ